VAPGGRSDARLLRGAARFIDGTVSGNYSLAPEIFRAPQCFQQPCVGSRKFIVVEVLAIHPRECRTTERTRLVRQPFAAEEFQPHPLLGIGMFDFLDEFMHGDFDAEFFSQLTSETSLK